MFDLGEIVQMTIYNMGDGGKLGQGKLQMFCEFIFVTKLFETNSN
jgi:hypothetical protein